MWFLIPPKLLQQNPYVLFVRDETTSLFETSRFLTDFLTRLFGVEGSARVNLMH